MARYKALVKKEDGSAYKAGDIIRAENEDFEFSDTEKELFHVVEIQADHIQDLDNINAPLLADIMESAPSTVKQRKSKFLSIARIVDEPVVAPSRYRINKDGKPEDKRHD